MDTDHAKRMMDAFYEAKRVRDLLPPLPAGVHPSYINTLDAVRQLSAGERPVRVSDVADFQRLPRPGVTRTVKEMESMGLLEKQTDPRDRRVVHLALTEQGEALYQRYVQEYFGELTQKLQNVSDGEVEAMIRTIHRIREALQRE